MPVNLQSQYNLQQNNLCKSGHSIFKETCPSCISMKKEWYSYLNRSGFEDVERGLNLVTRTEELFKRSDFNNLTTFNAKRDYYSWAQECLTTCSFDSMIDRLIWQHHAEGYMASEITPIVGLSNKWINRKIQRIESKIKK